ncbi:MAG: PAS domain S-box protein [Anaerolineae bacterium]|nr:PAS domain S-box protein [Anaerolineae bacterium]
MLTKETANEEIKHLRSQIAALEERLAEKEQTVLEQSNRLEQEIADRKQAEEALQKFREEFEELVDARTVELQHSQQFLRTIINNIPTPIFYKDTKGAYLGFNRAFMDYLGKSETELLGKTVFDLNTDQELAEKYHEADLALFRKPGTQTYEASVKYADGSYRDVIFSKTTFNRVDGNLGGLIGMIVDITEQKRAEAEFAKFKMGIERSTDAFFLTDKGGTITYVNPTFEAIYGFSREEAIGENPRIIKSGMTPPENYQYFWETLLSGGTVAGEIVNKTKDGQLIHISGNNNPIFDEAGNLIGFFGIHRDITERKHAEEMLAKRATELETVAEVTTATSTILDADRLLQEVVDLTKERFGLYHVHIYLFDDAEKTLNLMAGAGEVGRQLVSEGWQIHLDREQSLVAQAARTKQGVIANDVRQAPGFLQNPLLPETQSEMVVPMLIGEQVVGVLDVQSDKMDSFNQEDIRIYTILANEVASAVRNAQLFESVRQAQENAENRLKEAETLRQLTEVLAGTLRINEVIQAFFDSCTNMLGFDFVLFSLVDKAELRIKAVAGLNVTDGHIRRANHSLDSEDIMADIVRSGETEVIKGWDPRFDQENFNTEQMDEWGVRIFMPIVVRKENVGLVEVGFKKDLNTTIQERQLQLLRALIDQTAVALESAQRYEASRKMAKREQMLREITSRVRSSVDVDSVMRTTAQEVGKALGRPVFIHLGQKRNRQER